MRPDAAVTGSARGPLRREPQLAQAAVRSATACDTAGSRHGRRRRRRRTSLMSAAVLAAATALLVACASPAQPIASTADAGGSLHGTEIGDVIPRPTLVLTDTSGQTFDLQHRPPGELTTLFFGYTNCPDVCPTTMADLAAARRQLNASDRERLNVVFVTEDPENDTPQVLRRWLDGFDPSFTGLTGGNDRTKQALDALKAPQTEIVPPTPHPHDTGEGGEQHSHATGSGDSVEHTGSVYAFTGDRVVVYTGGTTPGQYAADFHTLLGP